MEPFVSQLERRVGGAWPNLASARAKSADVRASLRTALKDLDSVDRSIVASGSVGRGEVTDGSDVDWILLVDGQVDPKHHDLLREIKAAIGTVIRKDVGRERTFAHMVFGHDLVHLIGGADDTNANTTRRSLLLLESVPLGRREAFDRVVKSVLQRYLLEDRSFSTWAGPLHVPRFLLNDFARYWWTMAVDFAYKHRERGGAGAALRNLKLRFSRKLLYIDGLITCFACELGLAKPGCPNKGESCASADCVECLRGWFEMPPLEVLAALFVHLLEKGTDLAQVERTAQSVLGSYDSFVGILADPTERLALEELSPDLIGTDTHFDKGRQLSRTFRDGVTELFFELDPVLAKLTRMYGVF